MFPSKLFSTGGDELNANCYAQDNETQADLSAQGKTLEQALDAFTQTSHAALRDVEKRAVVWEGVFVSLSEQHLQVLTSCLEMVLVHNVTLSNNTIVMYALDLPASNPAFAS